MSPLHPSWVMLSLRTRAGRQPALMATSPPVPAGSTHRARAGAERWPAAPRASPWWPKGSDPNRQLCRLSPGGAGGDGAATSAAVPAPPPAVAMPSPALPAMAPPASPSSSSGTARPAPPRPALPAPPPRHGAGPPRGRGRGPGPGPADPRRLLLRRGAAAGAERAGTAGRAATPRLAHGGQSHRLPRAAPRQALGEPSPPRRALSPGGPCPPPSHPPARRL